jgi:hypothetical protein
MSKVYTDSLSSRSGGSILVVNNVDVTGIVTATSFIGDGAGLTGLNIPASSDWRDSSLF